MWLCKFRDWGVFYGMFAVTNYMSFGKGKRERCFVIYYTGKYFVKDQGCRFYRGQRLVCFMGPYYCELVLICKIFVLFNSPEYRA